ncbi:hypothetical protein RFF05_08280 [Bengtsoniella intestinalis]|uniref:hypothetical protein n=1 Tax=Bengtsoniella intestinalis TaxID=3073143 RepID=UPI00391FA547
MITIFNRKELRITYSLLERQRICDALNNHNIPYYTKVFNPSNGGGMGRGRQGSFGLNTQVMYEYTIYVKKADYELARHVIE